MIAQRVCAFSMIQRFDIGVLEALSVNMGVLPGGLFGFPGGLTGVPGGLFGFAGGL